MNLSSDGEGFIYFNELFFAIVKKSYSKVFTKNLKPEGVPFILNAEQKTMRKIK